MFDRKLKQVPFSDGSTTGHKDGEGFSNQRYMRGIAHRAGYYVYRDPATTYKTEPDGSKTHYVTHILLSV